MRNLKITVNGTPYDVQVEEAGSAAAAPYAPAAAAPAAPAVQAPAAAAPAPAPAQKSQPKPTAAGSETISCPMPGTIVTVNVKEGQNVKKGGVLVVLEAMKMENEIMAPHDAVVASVMVSKGESVETGAPLVSLR